MSELRSQAGSGSSWYAAIFLGCGYAVAFIDRGILGVVAAPVQHALHLSDSQFGLLHGIAFVLLFCVAGIPLGWLADRWSRRAIIAIGMLFWAIMTAACGLASQILPFFLARIGVGLGEACLLPAGASLLAQLLPRQNIARASAIFLIGATSGNALALLGGGYLLSQLSKSSSLHLPLLGDLAPWQILFLLAALPGLAAAPLAMTLPKLPAEQAPPTFLPHLRAALAHAAKHARAYGCLAGATACSNILTQTQGAWVSLFFMRQFGLPAGQAAMLVGIMYVISAPAGQFTGGWLTDKLQIRNFAGPQNINLAIGLALSLAPAIVFCSTTILPLAIAAYMLFNFIAFATTPNGLAGVQIITPAPLRGIMTAVLVSFVSLIGIGLGPALVGALSDDLFRRGQHLGIAMLVVFAIAGLAGPILALAGRRAFARAASTTPCPSNRLVLAQTVILRGEI